MLRLIQTVKTSYEPGSYVMDGCLTSGGSRLALTLSNQTIRLYDTQTTTFLFDLKDHNKRIMDITATEAQPDLLYSSQEDCGVMVSDVRQARAAHFYTELCALGEPGNTVAVSPAGTSVAVGCNGSAHIIDSRTWQPIKVIEQIHLDEITRLRFLDEHTLCSAGEDQMINFLSADPSVIDDDTLLQAINCGEVVTKMSSFPEVGMVAMIGTCENGYLCPHQLEETEKRYARPDYATYLVDWCVLKGELYLVKGVRDDDGNAGPLSVLHWSSGQEVMLPIGVHQEIGRVAIGLGDRLITGGEDGMLAFWRLGSSEGSTSTSSASVSSSPQGATRERVGAVRPMTHGNFTGGGRGGGGGGAGHPYGANPRYGGNRGRGRGSRGPY